MLSNVNEFMKRYTSESNLGDYAWYYANSGGKTHPVGQKRPNGLGLYDMSGNVWQWCQDWYGNYPSGSVTDPTGPSSGSGRVNRGGSWILVAYGCRSAYRFSSTPGSRNFFMGFRLARTP
jgi:formylglycine-generating enzyme required for sulfatase activity